MAPRQSLYAAACLFLAMTTASPAEEPPRYDDPRQLPSLEIAWRHGSRPIRSLTVDDGVVYATGIRSLAAHDAASGERLWHRSFSRPAQPLKAGPVLLEDHVAAVFGHELHLLHRSSGTTAGTYLMPEDANEVAIDGPPLMLQISRRDRQAERSSHRLLRLDEANAVPVAERVFEEIDLFEWWILDGRTVARPTRFEGEDTLSALIGLDADDLEILWRLPVEYGDLGRVDGVHYYQTPDGETAKVYAFDPASGTIASEPLVVPAQTGLSRFAGELVAAGFNEEPHLLRRFDPRTGEVLWTRELPAPPGPHLRLEDRLFVHCRPMLGGRGLLAEIGWEDGELRRVVYGLKGVGPMAAAGDLLIAGTQEGLVAFAADRFGPAETATLDVGDEVRRIVAGLERRGYPDRDAAGELKALGAEALPLLTELAETLGPVALQTVAGVLGEAAYRPAGDVLGRRLAADAGRAEPYAKPWQSPRVALLHALATTGGPPQVDVVGPLLLDPGEVDAHAARSIRRQAHFTLVHIGTPAALAWIDRSRTPPEPTSWWPSPDAGHWQALVGREVDPAELEAAEDIETHSRLTYAGLIRRVTDGDRRLLVFPYRFFDSTDLWAAEIDAAERPGEPFFLGVSHAHLAGDGFFQTGLAADLEAGRLLLRATVGDGRVAEIDLGRARSDRDGDGLPDHVEDCLGLDPESDDTDGDGIRDAEDPAPDARAAPPVTDEEKILTAVFEAYFRLWEANRQDGLGVVTDSPELEWRGRRGPTLTFDAAEVARLRDSADYSQILKIQIREADDDPDLADRRARLLPGERLYVVSTLTGSLGGKADTAVVRKIGDRWVVRWIEPWWIS